MGSPLLEDRPNRTSRLRRSRSGPGSLGLRRRPHRRRSDRPATCRLAPHRRSPLLPLREHRYPPRLGPLDADRRPSPSRLLRWVARSSPSRCSVPPTSPHAPRPPQGPLPEAQRHPRRRRRAAAPGRQVGKATRHHAGPPTATFDAGARRPVRRRTQPRPCQTAHTASGLRPRS
jgi:hypothetical protein